jgi:cytochrome c6
MNGRQHAAGRRQRPGWKAPERIVPGMALALAVCGAFASAPAAGPAAGADVLAAGKRLFTQGTPACATCHTLRHAGAEGAIGPNLDELGPDAARVEKAVRNGIGVMPPFAGKLSDEEIGQLASYVAAASRLP